MRELATVILAVGCAPRGADASFTEVPELVAVPGALQLADREVRQTCVENTGADELVLLEVERIGGPDVSALELPLTLPAGGRICVDVVGGEDTGVLTFRAEAPAFEVLRPDEAWQPLDRWLNIGVSAEVAGPDGGLLWHGAQHLRRYQGEADTAVVLTDVVNETRCVWDTATGEDGRRLAAGTGVSAWTYPLEPGPHDLINGGAVLNDRLICEFGETHADWSSANLWVYGWDGLRRRLR